MIAHALRGGGARAWHGKTQTTRARESSWSNGEGAMRKLIGMVTAAAVAGIASLAGVAHAAAAGDNQKVWDAAMAVAKVGPVDVPLAGQAVLHLPAAEVFVPQPQADKLLDSFGNPGSDPEMLGLILPRDPHATWAMPVRFRKSGFIKDDDARTWDAAAMLRSLHLGTEEQNKEREKAGVPGLEVTGWSEPPQYDAARQRLVWAMTASVIGAKPDAPQSVNYNTYALGREGYFSLVMLTALSELPALKPAADRQIAALEYNAGKRYADFDPKTDRVAGYGLVGLVVGAADHKDSVVAQAVAFVRQYPAAIIAGFAVLAAIVMALRRRRAAPAKPGAGAAFVNTAAESPTGAPVPPVDLDLGEGPAPSAAQRNAG
jgi:uncharacterized membrane-anchored protein